MEQLELIVTEGGGGKRLDKFIFDALPSLSRSNIQRIIEGGHAVVNGAAAGKSYRVKSGDRVSVNLPEPEGAEILPENIPLDIVFEDGDLLVINKPKGMVVHPAPGNYGGTLVNALMHHCGSSLSGINGVTRPGIVHRIDKDTSGLLIAAKNDFAHNSLAGQIQEHSFKREYLAVLRGNLKNDAGTVNVPIGRSPKDRKKQAVNGINARSALTEYEVLERYERFCLVKCALKTGRTHQIRVHMAYLGHPVAGDAVYGGEKNAFSLQGQCLHAATIGFTHPRSGEHLEFSSELPGYFQDFIKKVKGDRYEI